MLVCLLCLPDSGKCLYLIWVNFSYLIQVNLPLSGKLYFSPDAAQKEPRVADLDDGYTRIANELLEAVMLAGLTQHQLLVFLAVMRKTYGFNKKLDWVSNEQLSELTGILPHKCSAAKSVLVKRGILSATRGSFCAASGTGKLNISAVFAIIPPAMSVLRFAPESRFCSRRPTFAIFEPVILPPAWW